MNTSWGDYTFLEYSTGEPDIDPKTAPCTPSELSSFAHYFIPVLFSLAFVVGLIGNGLVLAVLGKRPCPWLFADRYLFQLAIADLLLALTLPFWATQLTHKWVFGEFLCKVVGTLTTMNGHGSVFLLACLSVERYLAIVRGIQLHHWLKLSYTYLVAIVVWGICLILSAMELHFRTAAYTSQARKVLCDLEFDSQNAQAWRLSLRLISFTFGFLIPLLVMVFCYCRIFLALRRAQGCRRPLALYLLVVILALFVIFWGPFYGFIFVDSLQRLGHLVRDCAQEKVLDSGLLFTQSLGLVHCCLNPLVYAFAGVKFRRELSRLFHRSDQGRECQQSSSGPESQDNGAEGLDYSIMM
uniref:G-protein coupled receptors family 1 profile domain-containing protein n=1 Tax=Salvator merianae TaxID=96440 RepID=A0A8D0BJ62_SALMN